LYSLLQACVHLLWDEYLQRFRYTIYMLILLSVALSGQIRNASAGSLGGRLVIGMVADANEILHPLQSNSISGKRISDLIFGNGPLEIDESGKINSGFFVIEPLNRSASSWRMLLRRGVAFHDGNYLANTDVSFTLKLIQKFGGGVLNKPYLFDKIASVQNNGDLELRFELKEGDRSFGRRLAEIPLLQERYYADALTQGYVVFRNKSPQGVGPYRWESEEGARINLSFHPNFYAGRPFLDEVDILFFDDDQQISEALVNDEIDFAELPDRASANSLHDLLKSKISVFLVPREKVRISILLLNINSFPLSEKEARKSLSLALNKTDLARGVGRTLNTIVPSDHPEYAKSVFPEGYSPEGAVKLLAGKGWRKNQSTGLMSKDGKPFSFEVLFSKNSTLEENLARTMLLNLRELNIDIKPIPVLSVTKKDRLRNGSFQAMIFSYEYDDDFLYEALKEFYSEILGAGLDKVNYRNRYISNLFRLIENGDNGRTLPERFQFFIHQEMPAVFLFHEETRIVAVQNRIRNFREQLITRDGRSSRLKPIEEWFIPRDQQRRSNNGN